MRGQLSLPPFLCAVSPVAANCASGTMAKRERNSSIIDLRSKGKSLSDIASLFHLSPGRVRQIVASNESLEQRRAELIRRYGARPEISELSDDTPVDVLILCDASIHGWDARVRQLQYGSIPIRTLGDLRGITGPRLLREPHIGPRMLAQLRVFCPFRRRGKKT
jgi:hypothetical protein